MLKKKLILPLLAVMLVLALLPVSAIQLPPELMTMLTPPDAEPVDFQLVSDNLTVYDTLIGKQMMYVAQVENKSPTLGTLREGTLQLLDAAGAEVGTVQVYGSTPTYVQPGETAYLTVGYSALTSEQLDQVASWQLTINAVVSDYTDDPIMLEVTTEVTEGAQMDYMTGMEKKQLDLLHTITNPTDEPAYDARLFTVVRDEAGKAVAYGEEIAPNVGILPGSSILLRGKLDAALVEALEAAGLAPVKVETIAFYVVYDF